MTLKNFLKKIKLSERTISAVLGVLVVVVAGVLLFNFFQSRDEISFLNGRNGEEITQEEQEEAISSVLPTTHKVSQGENLWRIAQEYYGSGYNWVDIAQTNSLRNADFLLVGQELLIPDVAVRWPETGLVDDEARVNTYTVGSGDSLWKIAVAVYGDGYQWTNIYEANEATIGSNPGLIYAGQVLVMP